MDQSIDLAPLKSIDFDLEASIFTIRFGPNNWSHPLKSIIKVNNLLPGLFDNDADNLLPGLFALPGIIFDTYNTRLTAINDK